MLYIPLFLPTSLSLSLLFSLPFNIVYLKKVLKNKILLITDLTYKFDKLEKWKLEAIWLLPNILSASTCLHAFLLTSLRLLSLEMPMKYKVINLKKGN